MKPKTELPLWQQKLQNRMALQEALHKDPQYLEKLAAAEQENASNRPKKYRSGHMAAMIEWDECCTSVTSMAAE